MMSTTSGSRGRVCHSVPISTERSYDVSLSICSEMHAIVAVIGRVHMHSGTQWQTRPRLMKVANIITRTAHYERFTMSGTGCVRNGKPAPRLGSRRSSARAACTRRTRTRRTRRRRMAGVGARWGSERFVLGHGSSCAMIFCGLGQVRSFRGFKRVGRHSECIGRGPGWFK